MSDSNSVEVGDSGEEVVDPDQGHPRVKERGDPLSRWEPALSPGVSTGRGRARPKLAGEGFPEARVGLVTREVVVTEARGATSGTRSGVEVNSLDRKSVV